MRFFYTYAILILMILVSVDILAQEISVVRGTVSDSNTGERIIGATITEYDLNGRIISGTITDFNGNYILKVQDQKSQFKVSYIGYKTQEFTINGRESIQIRLETESIQMEEVVVTAQSDFDPLTGTSQRDITGSRIKIDMSESKHRGATSAEEALQGKVSGLDIMSVSGDPGSGSQIVIRGLGSMGGSKPLIVIDGIPQDIRIESSFDFGGADQEDIGDLVNLAPQDIASIEVLKDAASTAVWGSKGADGVLLIKTNRGRTGKTSFEYIGRYTWKIQPPPVPMLTGDEYIMLQLEQLHNQLGVFEIPPELAYDPNYDDFYNYNKNTNWIDAISRNGFVNDQFFKVSGGGEKTRYYGSVNYVNDKGTTLNTSLNRLATRINLDYNVSRKIKFHVNFNYSNSLKGNNYVINKTNVREMAYIKAPNMSIWDYNKNGAPTGEYFTPVYSYQGDGDLFYNPVAVANLSINDNNEHDVQNSFILNYSILPRLNFEQTIAFQYLSKKSLQFLPTDAIGTDWLDENVNQARESNRSNTKVLSRSILHYSPGFRNEAHVLKGSMMFEIEQTGSQFTILESSRGPSGSITDPAANAPINDLRSGSNESNAVGMLGNVSYIFKRRYILTANARLDGSSKFGRNQRWGLFPSISAAWRFSDESALKDQKTLSNGKIRVSMGQTGKQPGRPYDRHAIFNTAEPNLYIDDPIIIPQQVQLENLKWQTLSDWNLGLDLGFWSERLTFNGEIYRKVTTDILWDKYQIPQSTGFALLKWYNGGTLENRGWEVNLRGDAVRKENFSIILNFNLANNINSFLEFPSNFNTEVDLSIGNGQYPRKVSIGHPIGSFYGFRYLGVWASDEEVRAVDEQGDVIVNVNGDPVPLTYKGLYEFKGGDARYEDVNHDGKIDLLDVVYLGDSNPRFIGGFGGNMNWKRFMISCQFHFRTGYQIVNEVAMNSEGMRNRNNQSKAVLKRWRVQGQEEPGMLPRAYMSHPANNLGSDRYVEDGDFLRLNNVTLRYRLPKELSRRVRFKSLDFALTMRKILTLTQYSGQDPELPQQSDDPFWFGTDKARTPISKSFILSISAGF